MHFYEVTLSAKGLQEKQRGQVANASVPTKLVHPGGNEKITKKEQEADKPSWSPLGTRRHGSTY